MADAPDARPASTPSSPSPSPPPSSSPSPSPYAAAQAPAASAPAPEPEAALARPLGPVSVQVQARRHVLVQDKPRSAGGNDEGMMASELLMAAVLGCQHSTFVKVAAKRRVDARVESLAAETHFDGSGDIKELRVHFVLECPVGLTDAQIIQVCRLTDRACTISKALRVPVNWSYERRAAL